MEGAGRDNYYPGGEHRHKPDAQAREASARFPMLRRERSVERADGQLLLAGVLPHFASLREFARWRQSRP
jgi:hypothetical protein